jgi:hypothetical protein
VHIEGRALAPAGLQITPTSLSFGAVKLGALSEPQTVRVTNRGAAGAIRAVSVSGGEFQISQDGCAGATLPPNASCELAVRFAPKTLGVATGTLTIDAGPCAGVAQTALGGDGI